MISWVSSRGIGDQKDLKTDIEDDGAPYRASNKGSKIREGKAADWWRNRIMMEDGECIFCLGFLREYIFTGIQDSATHLK